MTTISVAICRSSRKKYKRTSLKKKKLFLIFIAFLKCAWNVEVLERKDEDASLIISKIIESERGGYLNVKKVLLQNTIG